MWVLVHLDSGENPQASCLSSHCSVAKLCPTVWELHELHHARLPCPSPSPWICSNSCPLSQWCHLTIILCPLLLLPSIFPSIRVFSSESALCIRWPKDWSFSFSISPSNEYSGWISFRIEWFDLLAVQRTLKSLLQHHSSKASILQRSVFFMVSLFREASLQIPLVWCSVCGVGCAEYLCASLWRDVNFGSGWILTLNQI